MITIEHLLGYWTLCVNEVPILACTSFESAIYWMEQLTLEMQS